MQLDPPPLLEPSRHQFAFVSRPLTTQCYPTSTSILLRLSSVYIDIAGGGEGFERGEGMGAEEEEKVMEEKGPSKSKEEMEAEISRAMRARVKDFREQADSLTLEGVRRALEKDLGVKAFSLDVHKRFIKQCLEKFFDSEENESASKTEEKNLDKAVQLVTEEPSEQPENIQNEEETRDNNFSVDEEIEVGAPDRKEPSDCENEKSQVSERSAVLSEDLIKKAIKERASYFRANSKTITLQGVRRLLEEDLKLEKNTLDAYKQFISREVDEVFSTEVVQASNGTKNKPVKKTSQGKTADERSKGRKRTKRGPGSSDSDATSGEEIDEKIKRPKKMLNQKAKASPSEALKKMKGSTEKSKASGSGARKAIKPDLEQNSEAEGGNSSEDGNHSDSSSQEDVKKKREKPPTQAYGKKVEQLKAVIKSCGIGIPPSVYKRAKQAPESKREAYLVKELEEILEREGLSTNPSEKEIKAVRKKKERAKELEGIDMSNIVTSSRRRTTSAFIPPPLKPKELPVESEDDEEDEGNEESQEESDDGNDGEDSNQGSDEDVEDESD